MSRRLALALLLLAGLPAAAPARVFESLGRPEGGRYAAWPGWTRAHASAWTLNGAKTETEVWNAALPQARALDRLRAECRERGDVAVFVPGDGLAWGLAAGGGRVTRFLLTEMENGRQTLVFRFSQAEAEFRKTRAAPPGLPDELPAIPGARAVFTAAGAGGSRLAVYEAPGGAADAAAFLDRALVREGWSPVLGSGAAPDPTGLAFYAKGAAVCGFSAKMSRHDGSCTVTVFHRRLAHPEHAP